MTKAEIVNEVAKSTGIEKVQVQSVIEEFTKVVKDSDEGGEIRFFEFVPQGFFPGLFNSYVHADSSLRSE